MERALVSPMLLDILVPLVPGLGFRFTPESAARVDPVPLGLGLDREACRILRTQTQLC